MNIRFRTSKIKSKTPSNLTTKRAVRKVHWLELRNQKILKRNKGEKVKDIPEKNNTTTSIIQLAIIFSDFLGTLPFPEG